MKNNEITRKVLKRAERWYQGGIRAYEDKRWDDVIYSYEMAVERTMKAILILYGIEYPKKHDISNIYLELRIELPRPKGQWIRTSSKIADIPSVLHPLQTHSP
jgi:HEPN domain-containing protein